MADKGVHDEPVPEKSDEEGIQDVETRAKETKKSAKTATLNASESIDNSEDVLHDDMGLEDMVETERGIAFTDAVVAIALTLLILPLMDAANDAEGSIDDWYRDNKTNIVSFFVTFLVTSRFWFEHSSLFRLVGQFSKVLVVLNFLWMLSIVYLPVATALNAVVDHSGLARFSFFLIFFIQRFISLLMVLEVRRNRSIWASDVQNGASKLTWKLLNAIFDLVFLGLALGLSVTDVSYYGFFFLLLSPVCARFVRTRWPNFLMLKERNQQQMAQRK